MNLTTELKNNEYLKTMLLNKITFKQQTLEIKDNIKFPLKTDFKGSALVGTAYDYMFRFELSKKYRIHLDLEDDFIGLRGIDKKQQKYLKECLIKKEFYFESLIYISLVENFYRSGNDYFKKIKNLEEITNIFKKEIEDLKQFNIDLDLFEGKHYLLNPILGYKTLSADADLIIDDTLIDIKTITTAIVDREKINQIIMYSILASIYNVNIKNVGIFFSRYNILKLYKISDLIKAEDYKEIKDYLKRNY